MTTTDYFSNLSFSKFQFTLHPVGELRLPPYKGSAFRGAFMHQFRKTVCVTRLPECAGCILSGKCAYYSIFETENGAGTPRFLEKVRKIPHPFILEPPLDRRTLFTEGDPLTLNLILVGSAMDYLPYFIYTFEQMGTEGIKARGHFQLDSVASVDPAGATKVIYEGRRKILTNGQHVLHGLDFQHEENPPREMLLSFITPTRLVYENRLTIDVTFPMLIAAITRRLTALESSFCAGGAYTESPVPPLPDGVDIVRRDLKWHDWERYSNRQHTRMKMGGFVGELELSGEISLYYGLLRLGEFLHVGKGTSFGLGKFLIA
jgi:hypothetical protein